MPYFTGLARVARTTGYPVVEVAGWKTRGHGPMRGCRSVMVHHTATSRNAAGNYPSLRIVRDGHGSLPGPLSHYGLGRDGTIYVIAAGLCYHTGSTRKTAESNSYSIGIEAENDGIGEPWSSAQMDSYAKLCRALINEFKLPVSAVVGHKEAAVPTGRKIDPNFNMSSFRSRIQAVSTGTAAGSAPSTPSSNEASGGSTMSARKVWGFRGTDYVNADNTSQQHKVSKTHQYAHWLRNELISAIWNRKNRQTGVSFGAHVRRGDLASAVHTSRVSGNKISAIVAILNAQHKATQARDEVRQVGAMVEAMAEQLDELKPGLKQAVQTALKDATVKVDVSVKSDDEEED